MVNIRKEAVQQTGADPKASKRIANSSDTAKASLQGINGDPLVEPVPEFIETPSEKVIANANNSWIVLGRDRHSTIDSGYGGKGDTQAASIDIVCGRIANNARSVDRKTGEKLWADPDFRVDAARIYVSQKTDLDKNFGLTTGRVGTSSAKSGIAMKADAIRFIAREGIKLVTSEARTNSQGGTIQGVVGIDIIAGNMNSRADGTDLQPIPKGDNLALALRRLTDHVEKLNGIVTTFLEIQTTYNQSIMTHWHHSPFFAAPTVPSTVVMADGVKAMADSLTKTMAGLLSHKTNLAMFKHTYLKASGKKYICSRYNNVN